MTHTWHKQSTQRNQDGSHLSGAAWVTENARSGAFLLGYNDVVAGRKYDPSYETMTYTQQRRYERGRLSAAVIRATKPIAEITLDTFNMATAVAVDTVAFGK